MDRNLDDSEIRAIADEVLSLWKAGKSVPPYSERYPGFSIGDAYAAMIAASAKREAGGDAVVGRKVGFTNTAAWETLGISAPMWGYMFETTLFDLAAADNRFGLNGFAEPRLEPEIVVGLSSAPRPDMNEAQLSDCIEWVAHGFEVAQCIYPGWKFTAADAIANQCLHAAMLVGPRMKPTPEVLHSLGVLSLDLCRGGEVVTKGSAEDVLGGPLASLLALVKLLDSDPSFPALREGEVVTTGTLSSAPDIVAGEIWSTLTRDTPIAGIELRLD